MGIGIETKRRMRTRTRTASRHPRNVAPGVSPGAPTQGAGEEEKEEEKNKEEEDEQKDQEEDKEETGNPGTRAHLVSTAPARAFPPRHGSAPLPLQLGSKGLGRRSGARRGRGRGGASSAQVSLTYQKRDDAAKKMRNSTKRNAKQNTGCPQREKLLLS